MSVQNFDYLKQEFNFRANRQNPQGLDFNGIDAIKNMSQKIDKRPLRDCFGADGKMKAVPYQDFLFECRATLSKLKEKSLREYLLKNHK